MPSEGWRSNYSRGAGILFGPDITMEFLEENQLTCLVRSHQFDPCSVFKVEHNRKCVTVFTAENYAGPDSPSSGYYIELKSSSEHPADHSVPIRRSAHRSRT